jgi:hypothetical protein
VKAADFLGLDDLRTKTVTVPRWNKAVTIRELGLEEGVKLSQMYSAKDGQTVLSAEDIARVVAWGVVDENGERVFSDDDASALARKNRDPLMFLFREITSLSADFEEAEKN